MLFDINDKDYLLLAIIDIYGRLPARGRAQLHLAAEECAREAEKEARRAAKEAADKARKEAYAPVIAANLKAALARDEMASVASRYPMHTPEYRAAAKALGEAHDAARLALSVYRGRAV